MPKWHTKINKPYRACTCFGKCFDEQLSDAMQSGNLSKVVMAQRMVTSRSQLDRVLDPDNLSIQLDTLFKAARAVGKTVEIRLK
jgi:hypothetical protein